MDGAIMNLALLRRTAVFHLRHLGLPGKLGLILTAAFLGYLFVVALPAKMHGTQSAQRIAELSMQMDAAARNKANAAMTPAEKLAEFYRAFPKETTIPDWLGKIYAIADKQKLALEIGEYSLTQVKAGQLNQFRIVFPVKGNYPQIRKFIAATLATAPALALDSIDLKRDKVGESVADGRIVFLLYLEKTQ
jgi:Tfp pilus assembly protein PilO